MERLAIKFVHILISNSIIKKEDAEIYIYGFKEMIFLLINIFLEIVDSGDENKFDEILEKSIKIKNGVNYIQKKDFQINDFLQDIDNLKNISNIL